MVKQPGSPKVCGARGTLSGCMCYSLLFFNDTATTEIYTLSLHDALPICLYGAAWLRRIGAWDTLRTRLAETENVRAALALVARGETPLGLVYASDAQADAGVRVLFDVPPDMHPPILYPAAAITPAGVPFLQHLIAARARFADAGFVALP